jgi:hypothetical protein
MRRTVLVVLATACFGVFAQAALAGGGSYTFVGGTAREQATVRSALNASSFDWGLIPRSITFTIGGRGAGVRAGIRAGEAENAEAEEALAMNLVAGKAGNQIQVSGGPNRLRQQPGFACGENQIQV